MQERSQGAHGTSTDTAPLGRIQLEPEISSDTAPLGRMLKVTSFPSCKLLDAGTSIETCKAGSGPEAADGAEELDGRHGGATASAAAAPEALGLLVGSMTVLRRGKYETQTVMVL